MTLVVMGRSKDQNCRPTEGLATGTVKFFKHAKGFWLHSGGRRWARCVRSYPGGRALRVEHTKRWAKGFVRSQMHSKKGKPNAVDIEGKSAQGRRHEDYCAPFEIRRRSAISFA